jgi:hypothetical protein
MLLLGSPASGVAFPGRGQDPRRRALRVPGVAFLGPVSRQRAALAVRQFRFLEFRHAAMSAGVQGELDGQPATRPGMNGGQKR